MGASSRQPGIKARDDVGNHQGRRARKFLGAEGAGDQQSGQVGRADDHFY